MGLFDSIGNLFTGITNQALGGFSGLLATEAAARSSALSDAIKDPNLDPTTKAQLQALYDSGADSGQISSLLNKAREGKGIYAVRKQNFSQEKIMTDMPGRAQILSLNNPPQPSLLGGKR